MKLVACIAMVVKQMGPPSVIVTSAKIGQFLTPMIKSADSAAHIVLSAKLAGQADVMTTNVTIITPGIISQKYVKCAVWDAMENAKQMGQADVMMSSAFKDMFLTQTIKYANPARRIVQNAKIMVRTNVIQESAMRDMAWSPIQKHVQPVMFTAMENAKQMEAASVMKTSA